MRRIAILLFSFILLHVVTREVFSTEKAGKLTHLRIAVAVTSSSLAHSSKIHISKVHAIQQFNSIIVHFPTKILDKNFALCAQG